MKKFLSTSLFVTIASLGLTLNACYGSGNEDNLGGNEQKKQTSQNNSGSDQLLEYRQRQQQRFHVEQQGLSDVPTTSNGTTNSTQNTGNFEEALKFISENPQDFMKFLMVCYSLYQQNSIMQNSQQTLSTPSTSFNVGKEIEGDFVEEKIFEKPSLLPQVSVKQGELVKNRILGFIKTSPMYAKEVFETSIYLQNIILQAASPKDEERCLLSMTIEENFGEMKQGLQGFLGEQDFFKFLQLEEDLLKLLKK